MSTVAPRHTGDAGDIPGTAGVTYGPATTTSTSAAAGRTVDLKDVFARLDQPWQPKVVARLNDYDIKCARLEGAFVWHDHPDTDELFIVMNGSLAIHLHTSDIALGPGQLYVVPRGFQHCPVADGIVHTLLIEPWGTVNTGTETNERTYDPDDWTP